MNSISLFNGCFAQLCKIPTNMFYRPCVVLSSELGKLWEPIICRKSDQIIPLWIWTFVRKGLLFWFQTELILHHLGHSEQQLISTWIWISLQLLTHLWIKILGILIPYIWNHMKGIVICAIMIPLWNLYLLGPLLVCYLKSLVIDDEICISTNPLNWWRYFLNRLRYLAWCAKINHLVLTLSRRLLYILHRWSRIILYLIGGGTLNFLRWALNCLDIIITS